MKKKKQPDHRRGRGATLARALRLYRFLECRRHGLSIPEAVAEFAVSRRTIYRDLAAIQEAGYPLVSSREDGEVRWMLTERFARGVDAP